MDIGDFIKSLNKLKGFDDLKHHNKRVGIMAYKLALTINLKVKVCNEIRIAGSLHDVGKIFIPNNILNKPTCLNDNEFNYMKNHSLYSYLILKHYGMNENICNAAKLHHESFDGTGYPFGLKGNDIPLSSRILKVCDVYDALTSDRIYRSKFSKKEAISIMLNESVKYDPYILDKFLLSLNDKNDNMLYSNVL